MTTSSEAPRTRVLPRGTGSAVGARAARLTSDLRSSPFATALGADARLVDPVLERVVEERAARAEEQGRAVGYAEGYAQGRAAAQVEAAAEQARTAELAAARTAAQCAELERARDALLAAAAQFEQRLVPAAAEIEALALRAAVDLATTLVARELRATDDVVLATAARALSLAAGTGPVMLRVAPADGAILAALPPAGRPVELLPDPGIAPGSCVVETDTCTVDGRIDDALARARALLVPEEQR